MKNLTLVLTAAALAASILTIDKSGSAQTAGPAAPTLSSLTAKGYDPTLASDALLANTDAATLLAQINATRRANGLTPLALDPSLAAAAMYQESCQVKWHYSGNYSITNGGTSATLPAQSAADFGSPATAVQADAFGNGFFLQDTDNWPALMADWEKSDAVFTGILNSAAVNVCGLYMVDTGILSGATHVYKWVLYVGYNPSAVTTTGGGSTINLAGLNQALAQQALAATPSAAETAFLASINAYRATEHVQSLAMQPSLYASAYYDMHDTGADNTAALAGDFGGLFTTYEAASGTNNLLGGELLGYYGNWTTLWEYWRLASPTFASLLADGSYSHCGLCIVDSGTTLVSPLDNTAYEVYNWVLVAGK